MYHGWYHFIPRYCCQNQSDKIFHNVIFELSERHKMAQQQSPSIQSKKKDNCPSLQLPICFLCPWISYTNKWRPQSESECSIVYCPCSQFQRGLNWPWSLHWAGKAASSKLNRKRKESPNNITDDHRQFSKKFVKLCYVLDILNCLQSFCCEWGPLLFDPVMLFNYSLFFLPAQLSFQHQDQQPLQHSF